MVNSVPQDTFFRVIVACISPGRLGSSNLSVYRIHSCDARTNLRTHAGCRRDGQWLYLWPHAISRGSFPSPLPIDEADKKK